MALAAVLHIAQALSLGFTSFRSTSCECHCRGDPSAGVLTLLGEQLARCGPENLARSCPPPPSPPWYPGEAVSLILVVAGFVAGAAAATLGIHRDVAARFTASQLPSAAEASARPALAITEAAGPLTPAAKRASAAGLRHGGSSLSHA